MHEVSVTYLHNGEQHSVTAGSLMSGIADKPPLYRNQPPPYSLKREGPWELPIPDQVNVHWRDADDDPHDQQLAIGSAIPNVESFSGVIWICLTKDKATMLARTDAQEKVLGQKWNSVPDPGQDYSWDFFNAAAAPAQDVSVIYERDGVGHSVRAGTVPVMGGSEPPMTPTPRATHGDSPIPDPVRVHWKDGQGRAHEQEFDVSIPAVRSFAGVIWVCIDNDGAAILARDKDGRNEYVGQPFGQTGPLHHIGPLPETEPATAPAAAESDTGVSLSR